MSSSLPCPFPHERQIGLFQSVCIVHLNVGGLTKGIKFGKCRCHFILGNCKFVVMNMSRISDCWFDY